MTTRTVGATILVPTSGTSLTSTTIKLQFDPDFGDVNRPTHSGAMKDTISHLVDLLHVLQSSSGLLLSDVTCSSIASNYRLLRPFQAQRKGMRPDTVYCGNRIGSLGVTELRQLYFALTNSPSRRTGH